MPQFDQRFRMATGTPPETEVLRKNHWQLIIGDLNLTLNCKSISMPKYQLESVEVYYYNERTKLASKPNVSDFKIEVYDTLDPDVVGNLDRWYNEAFDTVTANLGYASTYKKMGTIRLFDVHGRTVRSWYAHGLWLKHTPVPDGYDYSSGDPVTISCDISCDWVTRTPNTNATTPQAINGQ